MSTIEFSDRFNALHNLLFGFAMRITKNVEDARDLMQETALRAYKNRDRFQMGTNFRAWMSTIMKNTFINGYRRNSKRKDLELPIDKFLFALENNKTENNADASILMDELNDILDSLDDNYRIPFTLFYEGYQYNEISEKMNIPIGTVKSRIFYARKQLQEKITARYGDSNLYR